MYPIILMSRRVSATPAQVHRELDLRFDPCNAHRTRGGVLGRRPQWLRPEGRRRQCSARRGHPVDCRSAGSDTGAGARCSTSHVEPDACAGGAESAGCGAHRPSTGSWPTARWARRTARTTA
jgi:hypothetical protein